MATIPYDEPIGKNTDWGGDSSTGGRPVAGGRVQDFIKGSLQDLDDRIKNISGLGRFLSGWDCTTGLAVTNPTTNTYEYPDGAFYIVAKVGATNYRPSGNRYVVGSASKTVETSKVKVGDVYKYDGSAWLLIALDTQEIPAFSNETAGTIRGKAQDGWVTAEGGYGKVQGWQDATTEVRGLMTAADKAKLDEMPIKKTEDGAKIEGNLHVAGEGAQGRIDFSDLNDEDDNKGYCYIGEVKDDDYLTMHANGEAEIEGIKGVILNGFGVGEILFANPPEDSDDTQIATTGWVNDKIGEKAPIDSPEFEGTPTAPTPQKGDNSTKIATTAFVTASLSELGLSEAEYSYGVYHEDANSAPECVRVGNTDFHKTLPIHSMMRGCLLNDNGEVVKYLDADDWTGETRDGSQGQVMVEIPAHYRRFNYENNRLEVRISEKALLGYHFVPKMYVSAYEASLQRSTGKLSSVVNASADYRGGGNSSSWDGTYRSLLGRPVTSINLTKLRDAARLRKSGSTQWNCYTYEAHKALYWLFVIEYATLNSQANYTPELTSDGYRQGGLGQGVTNFNNLNSYNSSYPFVPCGHTDSLGNGTGVVDYEVKGEDGATVITCPVPRYRGIENPFGHIFKYVDGILLSNLSVYTCKDPSLFSSKSSAINNYTLVGKSKSELSAYIKTIVGGIEGEILPASSGGSSNTYFCDMMFVSSGLRGVLFGGLATTGAAAGFVFADASNAPSYADADVGSRLCFHP